MGKPRKNKTVGWASQLMDKNQTLEQRVSIQDQKLAQQHQKIKNLESQVFKLETQAEIDRQKLGEAVSLLNRIYDSHKRDNGSSHISGYFIEDLERLLEDQNL